ncbi:MAG TPA: C1 family peptidase [Thermodesulfobacteriota bacterium]|nr:C1 family peptidase [Thermodesulfobacteriota bacterium]
MTKKGFADAAVILTLLLFFSGIAFASELDDVKAAIKAHGGNWRAGDTSVSGLSHEMRKLRVSLHKPVKGEEDTLVSLSAPATGLPTSLDWRNYNSQNYVTGMRDQGNCGSCWAFASTAALESLVLLKNATPGVDENFAEQILLSCGDQLGNCAQGGYIDRASNFIRDTGLPDEACYAYTATDGDCTRACGGWQANTHRSAGWKYIATTSPNVDAIKTALNNYGPLVTTMDVYTDFFYYKGGIYTYQNGNLEGGHAVLIVGYDDSDQHFIVKNSWGTGWGEGGFFNIAYSQVNRTVQFGYWTIAYLRDAPCTYSISPTANSVPSAGGTASFDVSAGANCSWASVSNNGTWIVGAAVSGSGSSKVSYTVAENTSTTLRKGTVSLNGGVNTITHTVTQAGCACGITPSNQPFLSNGGPGTITVNATSTCTWTAASSASWVTITSGKGTGNGRITYTVAPNTTRKTRQATITVGGAVFTISQKSK